MNNPLRPIPMRPVPMMLRAALFAAGVGFALTSAAVHTVSGDSVPWGAAPPSLPAGAQASVLYGNPGKNAQFVLRLRFPAGFVVPPHSHSQDELVTVISGRFGVMAGDKVDRAAFKPVPNGSFINIPAGSNHYAIAESESVVQINGMGPFDITYVNAKDDPRGQ